MEDTPAVLGAVMAIALAFLPLILVLVGLAGRRKVDKAKFYRRNGAGVETFSSYENMEVTKLKEGTLGLISTGILLLGILSLPMSCVLLATSYSMMTR